MEPRSTSQLKDARRNMRTESQYPGNKKRIPEVSVALSLN